MSYLGYRFSRVSCFDTRLKGDTVIFAFSYRALQSLGRCSRACLTQPVGVHCVRCAGQLDGWKVVHMEQHERSAWILGHHFYREIDRAKRRRGTVDGGNNPNHLEHMMSLDTNGTGARTVKRTTNVQRVPSYIELRTVVSSEMLPHPPATPLTGRSPDSAAVAPDPAAIAGFGVRELFPNWPTPDEDN